MPTATFRSRLDAPAGDVFDWHSHRGAFARLAPPWQRVVLLRHDGIRDGHRVVFRVRVGPFMRKWVAEHRDYVEGEQFCDVQRRGPFRRWKHVHRVYADPRDPAASYLEDHIEYSPPLGEFGMAVAGGRVRRELDRLFAYRHRVLQRDTAVLGRYDRRPLRIAVTGASGQIGSALVPFLQAAGHEVLRIIRTIPKNPEEEIYWNPQDLRLDEERLEGLDAVIHLAGEAVLSMRWSDQKKMQLYGSRVRSTELLARTLARLRRPPRVLLSASAMGYYGNREDEVLTEASAPGQRGFLAPLTQDWEAATAPAAEGGIRTVCLRFGAVLSPDDGVLASLLPAFRMGLGGHYGHAGQYISWIARDDALYAMYHLLQSDDLSGSFNLTAPTPVTTADFAQTLGSVLSRPTLVRVPPIAIRLFYGEVADETVLQSTRVLPERLQASGFTFTTPTLEPALRHLLGQSTEVDGRTVRVEEPAAP